MPFSRRQSATDVPPATRAANRPAAGLSTTSMSGVTAMRAPDRFGRKVSLDPPRPIRHSQTRRQPLRSATAGAQDFQDHAGYRAGVATSARGPVVVGIPAIAVVENEGAIGNVSAERGTARRGWLVAGRTSGEPKAALPLRREMARRNAAELAGSMGRRPALRPGPAVVVSRRHDRRLTQHPGRARRRDSPGATRCYQPDQHCAEYTHAASIVRG